MDIRAILKIKVYTTRTHQHARYTQELVLDMRFGLLCGFNFQKNDEDRHNNTTNPLYNGKGCRYLLRFQT